MSADVDVLYEDGHLLVVAKPAGLATQGRDPSGSSLEARVWAYLGGGEGVDPYVGTVHRLDRPTSGVMVWAKTRKAARRLADEFAERRVAKVYAAVVEGRVEPADGSWVDWLYEEETGVGVVQVSRPGTPRGREAVTRFERRAVWEGVGGRYTMLRLSPRTGRTHQLRVQASWRGWPIVGDGSYGATMAFASGIALHALSIELTHPTTGAELRFHAPLPESWLGRGWPLDVLGL